LPFTTELFFFRRAKMATLFPASVVDWLVMMGKEWLARKPGNESEAERQRLGAISLQPMAVTE